MWVSGSSTRIDIGFHHWVPLANVTKSGGGNGMVLEHAILHGHNSSWDEYGKDTAAGVELQDMPRLRC